MEELRITARRTEEGELRFDSYDAEGLFMRATHHLNRRQCAEAVALYDRLADEFPASRYLSPGLYNSGLCLQDTGKPEQAVARYSRLVAARPDSPDVKHASFQLARLGLELELWDQGVAAAERLLEREDLSPDEREEAMARRAQGLLGARDLEGAARQARTAISYYRTRPEEAEVRDNFFVSAANFVLAETFREQSMALPIPEAPAEEQRQVLELRARFMLDAQREYFNTMAYRHAHWAGAAGYRIGAMYDAFWEAIMGAPTPPPNRPMTARLQQIWEEEYRAELARMIKPLTRHAIRYWELTLMMVERTGVRTEWAERVEQDLERARARLLAGDAQEADTSQLAPTPEATRFQVDESAQSLSAPQQ